MPTYQYFCDQDDGGCGELIEITCSFDDKPTKKPKSCPKCRKRKALYEVFAGGSHTFVPKTLGHTVDKNSSKMSDDEKHHLTKEHNKYKEKPKDAEPAWVEVDGGLVHKSKL